MWEKPAYKRRVHKKQAISILLLAIIVFSFPFVAYLGSSLLLIYDTSFYHAEFLKQGVYSEFGNTEIPDGSLSILISYFKSNTDIPPKIPEYTEAENSHMRDVKQILDLTKCLFYISFLSLIISILLVPILLGKENLMLLAKAAGISGIAGLLFGFLLILLALNFQNSFTGFHLIFFPQGNWIFPADSSMIRMFPEPLFADFFLAIIIRGAILSITSLIIGLMVLKRFNQKKSPRPF